MTPEVVIDTALGELRIGGLSFPIAEAFPDGAVHLLPPGGPVLRPITFGERMRRVERASYGIDPVENLCAAITACATVAAGDADLSPVERDACQTLALVLAGADVDAPPFADAMLLLGGGGGWGFAEIESAEAVRADRLARRLEPKFEEADDGWSRVVFQGASSGGPGGVRRDLARRLLGRFVDEPVHTGDVSPPHAIRPGVGVVPGNADADAAGSRWKNSGVAESATSPGMVGESEPAGRTVNARRPDATPAAAESREMEREKGERRDREAGAMPVPQAGEPMPRAQSPAVPDRAGSAGDVGMPGTAGPGRIPPGAAGAMPSTAPFGRQHARVLGYRFGGWEQKERGSHLPVARIARAGSEPAAPRDHSGAMADTGAPAASGREGMASPLRGVVEATGGIAGEAVTPGMRLSGRSGPGSGTTGGFRSPETTVAPRWDRDTGGEPRTMPRGLPGDAMLLSPSSAPMERSSWEHARLSPDWMEPEHMLPLAMAGALITRRPENNGMAAIIMEMADALADMLNEEADLRGIDR